MRDVSRAAIKPARHHFERHFPGQVRVPRTIHHAKTSGTELLEQGELGPGANRRRRGRNGRGRRVWNDCIGIPVGAGKLTQDAQLVDELALIGRQSGCGVPINRSTVGNRFGQWQQRVRIVGHHRIPEDSPA